MKDVPTEKNVIRAARTELCGQKNYPEYIKYIIKEIATLRNVTENEIEETTFSNGKVFFGV